MRLHQAVGQAGELDVFLIRRVDQDQAAAFLGRDISEKRHPAVDCERLDAGITMQRSLQPGGRSRFKLASNKPILPAQQRLSDQRRSGIEPQRPAGIERGNELEIRRKQGARRIGFLPIRTLRGE